MAEPVTITEAKAQVNMVNDNSQDTFLTSLLAPARAYVERATRYFWVAATRTETFGSWGEFLEIHRRPIASVASPIVYTDESGASANYTGFLAVLGRYPFRIYPAVDGSFPTLGDGGLITVTYTSGALDATSEEYLLGKRAMLLLIGHWFENREAYTLGVVSSDVDFAICELLGSISPLSAY